MSFKTALGSLFLFGNDSKNSTTCFDQFKPMCAFDSDAGSSVFAVVRATCKALLTGHGSDKSGAGGYFQSFMRGKELTMQLADTAHSRMNVVFVNAGSIFHHHEHIVKSQFHLQNLRI
jgi:hypothetical protein